MKQIVEAVQGDVMSLDEFQETVQPYSFFGTNNQALVWITDRGTRAVSICLWCQCCYIRGKDGEWLDKRNTHRTWLDIFSRNRVNGTNFYEPIEAVEYALGYDPDSEVYLLNNDELAQLLVEVIQESRL